LPKKTTYPDVQPKGWLFWASAIFYKQNVNKKARNTDFIFALMGLGPFNLAGS